MLDKGTIADSSRLVVTKVLDYSIIATFIPNGTLNDDAKTINLSKDVKATILGKMNL